jgi:hypothetical protein
MAARGRTTEMGNRRAWIEARYVESPQCTFASAQAQVGGGGKAGATLSFL